MRRLANIPGITFLLFIVWKMLLAAFTAQPVPSNDSFFYDGPVVNYLQHDRYCNPSLAAVMPISGTKVFSAYPPLYQAVLLGWMKGFGTSALAAIWLHLALLGAFTLTIFRVLQSLRAPALVINLSGLFLFGITFHDRPDTLAHVLGALAILAVVRSLFWPAAALLLLTFATSLQIGGIYSLWVALLTFTGARLQLLKFPWAAALALIGAVVALIALVRFGYPQLWAGFQEHVRITPSVTGLRLPRLDDLLKVARTAPGILLVIAGLGWMGLRGRFNREALQKSPALLLALAGALTALGLIFGCLLVLTPNTIHIAGYLQPLIVAGFLAAWPAPSPRLELNWRVTAPWLAAAMLVSIRAAGLTTWGVACTRDASYSDACVKVNAELDVLPGGDTVFVSAAYLYEAARRTNVTSLHSDWPAPATGQDWEARAIDSLKPRKLLLTQFDYYRRYENAVGQFKQAHPEVQIHVVNLARVRPPDASPALRKVIQHISWAPVIVDFSWPQVGDSK